MTTISVKGAARLAACAFLLATVAHAATLSPEAGPATGGAVLGFAAGLLSTKPWARIAGAAAGAAGACALLGHAPAFGLGFGAMVGVLLHLVARLARPAK